MWSPIKQKKKRAGMAAGRWRVDGCVRSPPPPARAGLEAGIRRCHYCCSSETAAPKTRHAPSLPTPRAAGTHTSVRLVPRPPAPCTSRSLLSCVICLSSTPVAWHLELDRSGCGVRRKFLFPVPRVGAMRVCLLLCFLLFRDAAMQFTSPQRDVPSSSTLKVKEILLTG